MGKQIPIYFDDAIILSPPVPVSTENKSLNRLKVGVFYKYGNRNGSYITDAVAEQLIQSATNGDTPVIGFYDPQTEGWASHSGQKLARAYGYVEFFDGWQKFTDSDGVERDYAVFSVVLFTRYYNEASFVVGSNQSMELDINSIQGDWTNINGSEYFVYTAAEIIGLCVIGTHEPCFSASAFFEKYNEAGISQYEKFSSLLAEIKAEVEEANKGGEHQMENELNPEVNEPTPAQEGQEQSAPENGAEFAAEQELAVEEPIQEQTEEPAIEFEALQNQINELQASLNEMTANFAAAQNRIAELEQALTSATESETALREQNTTLTASIATYEAERNRLEEERKSGLIEKYSHLLSDEDLDTIRPEVANFTYDELESKLAICYSNKSLAGSDTNVVPLPEPIVNEFALFMEKYRKN